MKMKKVILLLSCVLLLASLVLPGRNRSLTLASTTSTLDSGLFDVLLPAFEKQAGCRVKLIAVGSGQALRLGHDGNADVLLVHDPAGEEKMVNDGLALERLPVMHNYFWIVGPKQDPAGIAGLDAQNAFRRIRESGSAFVSRGDDSGTHKKELAIWQVAGGPPGRGSYLEGGSGMEASLRLANEKKAYCLTDLATWLVHRHEFDALEALVSSALDLKNEYSVLLLNPGKYPRLNHVLAREFAVFLRSPRGREIIAGFGRERFAEALFTPHLAAGNRE